MNLYSSLFVFINLIFANVSFRTGGRRVVEGLSEKISKKGDIDSSLRVGMTIQSFVIGGFCLVLSLFKRINYKAN